MPGQMTLMREPRFDGDPSDGQRFVAEQRLGSLQSPLDDVLVDGHTNGVAKDTFELRHSQACHRSQLGKPEIAGQIVFYIRKDQAQLVPGHRETFFPAVASGTVAIEQACRERRREAVGEERASRIASFHFRFERPSNVLDLRIAHLKTIHDFDAIEVKAALARHAAEDGCMDRNQQRGVLLLHFPSARRSGRNNVDVAMHRAAAMSLPAPAAGDVHGLADVDHDSGVAAGGSFDDAR